MSYPGPREHQQTRAGVTSTLTERETAEQCSKRLRVSLEAASLFQAAEVVDLHVDSFIWSRLVGYDISRYHSAGPAPGHFFRQVDLPRLAQVGIGGATWVITTNPWRTARSRKTILKRNVERLTTELESSGRARVVGNFTEYAAARRDGLHAAFIGIQGGNALGPPYAMDAALAKVLLRVTLVHLTNSALGTTSNPMKLPQTPRLDTEALVAELNQHRVLVDLAHISRRDFDRVLTFHSKAVPPIVTHTGVCGVRDHWRNLTDEQLRTIAARGGVVGIMYHSLYLREAPHRARVADVVRHVKHALDVCGTDAVCLGSDWDGLITTPSDMPTCLELPRLVDAMLIGGLHPDVIRKVLGGNFLRLLAEVRP